MNAAVHTLQNQHQCMQYIKKSNNFFNPGQTPVDVCNQPVYALTKEIQWREKDTFGSSSYFSLFGGLHIKKSLLTVHGELVKGSGLLSACDLSITGIGALVNVNYITKARYCLQVSIATKFTKLKEAYGASGSNLPIMDWLAEEAKSNPMCFYWKLILCLQLDKLVFLHSNREKNFHLYVLFIKKLIKWYFALDHYHYARWLGVHLYDLIHLHINCSDVYKAFVSGRLSFDKTTRPFSSIAADQLHGRNNEVIKSVGGATSFLNREDQLGLQRWGLYSSELASIVADYQKSSNTNFNVNMKHHEDTAASRNGLHWM